MSIAGGYYKALEAAHVLGMKACQLFTKNNNQWTAKELTADDIRLFRSTLNKCRLKYPTAHTSYLINLASPNSALYQRSIDALVIEVRRAEALGLSYLVIHPGTPTDGMQTAGLQRIIGALDKVHRRCPAFRVKILLETTAGQGQGLGHRFEQLAAILDGVNEPKRLGVCFDTCHVFAAGYPLWPEEKYQATMDEFQRVIGISQLRAFHLNDSQKPLGSRVDRHAHIGRGHLGIEPFRLLLRDARFQRHPMLLETPKGMEDGRDFDSINLATLWGLLGGEK